MGKYSFFSNNYWIIFLLILSSLALPLQSSAEDDCVLQSEVFRWLLGDGFVKLDVETEKDPPVNADRASQADRSPHDVIEALARGIAPALPAPKDTSMTVNLPAGRPQYVSSSYRQIELRNIPPLYVSPPMPGEGVWLAQGMPAGHNGEPVIWRTSYRPSLEFPNAVVHMILFDMKKVDMKLYIGSAEPGGSSATASVEPEVKPDLLVVTNALWKQKHSGEAGSIHRGRVIKPLSPGMATIVVYVDGSTDILEWNDGIPLSLVSDARQLRHLIVKDGKVVDWVIKGGKPSDGEIGLGMLLAEEQQPEQQWWGGMSQPEMTSGEQWFIATRSAFGIRSDGNLVFAAGYHISTKDLAKALALAGCERAIHGDANPHNVVGNLYYNGAGGQKAKLSQDQRDTLNRYDRSYTSDFFGFFVKRDERNPS